MLYHGVKQRKPGFILAYLVFQWICFAISVIFTLFLFVVFVFFASAIADYITNHPETFDPDMNKQEVYDALTTYLPVGGAIFTLFMLGLLALSAYFNLVVQSHYLNLKEELYGGAGVGYNTGYAEEGLKPIKPIK